MNAEKLWEQVKQVYYENKANDAQCSFEGVVAVSFSDTEKILKIQVKNAVTAVYLNVKLGAPLIEALESIVGAPAFIECVYTPQAQQTNPRFTTSRTDKDYNLDFFENEKPKSAIQTIWEEIDELKKRVEALESEIV